MLNGKPLIAYTIASAKTSKFLDRVILSSEDPEIIDVAKKLDLEVPFIRPNDLAEDKSPTLPVIKHALNYFKSKGIHYDAVCLLQVTSPFRSEGFIDKAIETFKSKGTDALISVLEVPHEYNPHWTFKPNKEGQLEIATGDKQIISRRQDLPPAYYRDGAIYITKSEVIINQDSLYGKSISFIQSDPNRHVNIDTLDDWNKAETLVKNYTS